MNVRFGATHFFDFTKLRYTDKCGLREKVENNIEGVTGHGRKVGSVEVLDTGDKAPQLDRELRLFVDTWKGKNYAGYVEVNRTNLDDQEVAKVVDTFFSQQSNNKVEKSVGFVP